MYLGTEQQFVGINVHDSVKMSIFYAIVIIGASFISVLICHVSHRAIGLSSISPILLHVVVYLISKPLVLGVNCAVFSWIDLLKGCVERVCESVC